MIAAPPPSVVARRMDSFEEASFRRRYGGARAPTEPTSTPQQTRPSRLLCGCWTACFGKKE